METPGHHTSKPDSDYLARIEAERRHFAENLNVHDLPDIYHYWSNRYLAPKIRAHGHENIEAVFVESIIECRERKGGPIRAASLGAGNCDFEIDLCRRLRDRGITDTIIDCLDLMPEMLERGMQLAREQGVEANIDIRCVDLNTIDFGNDYDVFVANQSLHHFVELESIFSRVREALPEHGAFITSDIIGRNGHQRWPEARYFIDRLWALLPERQRYHHQLRRLEVEFLDWDCAQEGFEGIRAQDILPLLVQHFEFRYFLAFTNLIDVFCDRGFGHNFSTDDPLDCAFIDYVAQLDEHLIADGTLKPTHILAVMTRSKPENPLYVDGLEPAACIRWPDQGADNRIEKSTMHSGVGIQRGQHLRLVHRLHRAGHRVLGSLLQGYFRR